MLAQDTHGGWRHHAVAAPAVCDDLGAGWQLGEAGGKLIVRDAHRPGDVRGGVFVGRTHVEDEYVTGLDAAGQLFPADRLQGGHVTEVAAGGPLGLSQPLIRELLDLLRQQPGRIAGQPVVDMAPGPAGGGQPRRGQDLQLG